MLQHQEVAAAEKLVSLFEPHTAIICWGKATSHETEFGRKLWFREVEGGLITEYRVLKGNPCDQEPWAQSVQRHKKLFGHPPDLATADRGGIRLPMSVGPNAREGRRWHCPERGRKTGGVAPTKPDPGFALPPPANERCVPTMSFFTRAATAVPSLGVTG